MFDIISYVFLFIRFFGNSVLGFFYAAKLSDLKHRKKPSLFIWTTVYMCFQFAVFFAFNRIIYVDNALSLLLDTGILLLLWHFMFKGSFGQGLFAALSLTAGKELLISIAVVVDYNFLFEITMSITTRIADSDPEGFMQYGEILIILFDLIIMLIAVGGYILLLRLYLKLISKALGDKTKNFAANETMLLILPSLSAILITAILKMLSADTESPYYFDLYDRYPVAKLWVPVSDLLLLCTVVASAVLFGRLIRSNDEKLKRRLLEEQLSGMEKEIAEIKDIYSDIRGLKHDMHNHIANISHYIKSTSGTDDKILDEYLGQMEKTVDRLDFSYNTGNPITDIIICRRAQEAEKKGITFKSDFSYPANFGIDAFDVGVILDNALENCIAACETAEETPTTYLASYVKGSLIFIETENNFGGKITVDPKTGIPISSKKASENHGLGLFNIRRCAEKYMGGIDIGISENKFTLTVMLHGTHK